MSFGQQRLWVLQQTLPEAATYNVPAVYRLQGPVDTARLQACLQVIQQRHEILRTALVQQDEMLLQKVLPSENVALPWQQVDWQQLTPCGVATASAGRGPPTVRSGPGTVVAGRVGHPRYRRPYPGRHFPSQRGG